MLSIGQRARHPRPFGSKAMLPSWLGGRFDLDVELVKLRRIDRTWRAQHQVLMALCLGESDDVTDVLSARQHHHYAIDPRRYPSVRRHAVLERVKQMTEPLADRFARMTEDLEHSFLQLAVVNSDAATTELVSVANDVVGVSSNRIRLLIDESEVFLDWRGEWVMAVGQLA